MRAVILGAGVGERLQMPELPPKIMLTFDGETLLARHVAMLRHYGVTRIDLVVGYRAERVEREIAAIGAEQVVQTFYNAEYERGSVVSLWTLRDALTSGEPVLLMDGDVLYDHRMIKRLLEAPEPNCFLLDRQIEEGEEPVKLCFAGDRLVDFAKRPEVAHDWWGEWIGFARFQPEAAAALIGNCERHVDAGDLDATSEDAIRDTLLALPHGTFGTEDVTGLPWIEIDFPEDLARARDEIFPVLDPLPAALVAD